MGLSESNRSELYLQTLEDHSRTVGQLQSMAPVVLAIADRMITSLKSGGKICFMGNGGRAADAQHLAAEFVGRFTRERRGLASIAFTTDTSILTAIGNDYGYESIFSRQVESLCRPGDVLVGITTSGNSPNVIKAMELAGTMGVIRVGMTKQPGGKLAGVSEHLIAIPSTITARVQECHLLIGHILCDIVEEACATGVND